MKKGIVCLMLMGLLLSGCITINVPAGNGSNNADSSMENQVNEENTAAQDEKSVSKESDEIQNLILSIGQGELVVSSGEQLALYSADGSEQTLKLENGTLNIECGKEKLKLTLPSGLTLDTFSATVSTGKLAWDASVVIQQLTVEVNSGEASLKQIEAMDCTLSADPGSLYFNGILHKGSAEARHGHIELVLENERDAANYDITVEQGSLRLGDEQYHGRSESDYIDNSAGNTLVLKSIQGDLSVQFK